MTSAPRPVTRRCTVWAPGWLETPGEPAAAARWPAVEMLLARARRRRLAVPGLAGALHWLSDGRLEPEARWPAAPLSRIGDGLPASPGWWLRADPVHLLPDGDALRLFPAEDVASDERGRLADAFNAHFGPAGWYLEALHPRRWYLHAPRPVRVEALSPHDIAGHCIYDFMPSGADGLLAAKLLTEAQMIFHAVEGRPEPTVNGLWLWGGGETPRMRRVSLPPLASDDPVLRGVWQVTGNPVRGLPANAAAWLARPKPRGLVALEPPMQSSDAFERDWCAPLVAALRRRELDTLDLLPGGAERFELTRLRSRRFWRRRKPIAEFGRM
ncbi:hypothetical protein BH24PSE2_BH24PSE2_16570 [soil metagenome]